MSHAGLLTDKKEESVFSLLEGEEAAAFKAIAQILDSLRERPSQLRVLSEITKCVGRDLVRKSTRTETARAIGYVRGTMEAQSVPKGRAKRKAKIDPIFEAFKETPKYLELYEIQKNEKRRIDALGKDPPKEELVSLREASTAIRTEFETFRAAQGTGDKSD